MANRPTAPRPPYLSTIYHPEGIGSNLPKPNDISGLTLTGKGFQEKLAANRAIAEANKDQTQR